MKDLILTNEVTQKELDTFLADLNQAAELEFESNFFHMRISDYIEEQTIFPLEMDEENDFIFAKLENRIVGLVWLGIADCGQFNESFEIDFGLWDLYVLPDYRHQGIAKKLYQAALKEAFLEHGKPTMRVGLQVLSDSSESYFQHLGFIKGYPEKEFSDFFYKQESL